MKKFILFFLLTLATAAGAKAQLTYDELQATVAEMNAQMPMSLGYTMQMTSASLTQESMVIGITINPQISQNVQMSEQELYEGAKFMLTGNEEIKPFMSSLVALNIGLTYIFSYNSGQEQFTINFKPSDLADIMEKGASPEEKLDYMVSNIKRSMPISAGNGINMTDFRKTDGYVEYVCEVDETLYDISQLEQSVPAMKEYMASGMQSDAASVEQIKIIVAAGYALRYTYRGNTTQKSFSIVLTVAELAQLVGEGES